MDPVGGATVPAWATGWHGPQTTAELIARLPPGLRGAAMQRWRAGAEQLRHTPAGTGARTEVVASTNRPLFRALDAIGRAGAYAADPDEYASIMAGRAQLADRCGLIDEWCTRWRVGGSTTDSRRRRAYNPTYWRRRWRRDVARAVEAAHTNLAPVGIRWCSNDASMAAQASAARSRRWAQSIELHSSDGRTVPLTEILAGRARRQYAELLARASGVAKIAEADGYTQPLLVTYTVPSRMHPTSTASGERRLNQCYDGSTPRQAHDLAERQWQAFRRRWFRRGRVGYWVLGVQPHKDGTPHYHLIIWVRPDERNQIEAALRRAFDAEGNDARGEYGLRVDEIKGGSAGAIAYVSRVVRYIARCARAADEDAEAQRASAWASVHGIRRYRTSHSRATLWRLLRAGVLTDTTPGTAVAAAVDAARRGDYATFIRGSFAMRLAYRHAIGRYGDYVRRVVGVAIDSTVYLRRRWTIRRRQQRPMAMVAVMPKNQGGSASPPRTPAERALAEIRRAQHDLHPRPPPAHCRRRRTGYTQNHQRPAGPTCPR